MFKHNVLDVEAVKAIERQVKNEESVITNEEYLRSCTVEELAGALYEQYSYGHIQGKLGKPLNSITEIVKWLNEKHIADTDR